MSIGLVMGYVVMLGLLYGLGRAWKPFLIIFRIFFQGALGAVAIYLFNLLAMAWKIEIPLNPFNVLWVGFLGAPGFLGLLTLKYLIKI
ncbi:MAG: pro-sigmaK processing inhibitor BofA family protein [Firmicutes bacterium]|nr:pro-sigmaK processing inhibitor BofA family protein [Bacillota bacterium]